MSRPGSGQQVITSEHFEKLKKDRKNLKVEDINIIFNEYYEKVRNRPRPLKVWMQKRVEKVVFFIDF